MIQLSANTETSGIDINTRGQVAFTESDGGVNRAKLYDGSTVLDLGTLGGPSAETAALNNRGQVAGSSSLDPAGAIIHAFRWSQMTGMVDLNGPGQGISSSVDINSSGQVAGSAVFGLAPDSPTQAFRWRPRTGMQDLGALDDVSRASALSDGGVVVGNSEGPEGGPDSTIAFRWTQATGISPIGTLPSADTTAADVNNAGHIVGGTPFASSNGFLHAFLWTPQEGLLDLGTGSGDSSFAGKINDRGEVIGSVLTFTVLFHGFVWTRESGLIEIGLGQPEVFTLANDLNAQGQVVGAFGERAYVWTRKDGVIDLNTRLSNAPPGLVLLSGQAISDNGSIVASANTGLFLLIPHAPSSPC
ncbi:hypothetical protein GCM10027321_31580 [Massilia terrae]